MQLTCAYFTARSCISECDFAFGVNNLFPAKYSNLSKMKLEVLTQLFKLAVFMFKRSNSFSNMFYGSG